MMKRLFLSLAALLLLAGPTTFDARPVLAHNAQHHQVTAEGRAAHGAGIGHVVGLSRGHGHEHHAPFSADHCTLAVFCGPALALAAMDEPVAPMHGRTFVGAAPAANFHGRIPDRDPPVPRA